ncbi:hypothetical protein NB836_024620, partial [Pseudomonas aeruginosa]|nr:hypothetical protein [Pseudomonas aeruginosa]
VGSAEVGYLAFAGEIGWTEFLLKFALPTLGGNKSDRSHVVL